MKEYMKIIKIHTLKSEVNDTEKYGKSFDTTDSLMTDLFDE